MKKMTIAALVVVGCSMALTVFAADTKAGTPATTAPAAGEKKAPTEAEMMAMMFPKAGAETNALKPIMITATWNDGKIHKGAHGPDSPEGTSKGKQTCKWAVDGLWAVCDIEDTSTVNKHSMTWKGHVAMGWDYNAKTYKGVMVDNMGTAGSVTGKIEGTKLVMTADHPMTMPDGMTMSYRLGWDWSDGKNIKFTDEHSMDNGATWAVGEEFTYKKGGST